jgi:hypothetical protein
MRKLIGLRKAAVVLVLIAGNSFAQQAAHTSTAERYPCGSGRTFFFARQCITTAQEVNAGVAGFYTNHQTAVPRSSFFTISTSPTKSVNQDDRWKDARPFSFESATRTNGINGVRKNATAETETNAESQQGSAQAPSATDAQELAKKLSNPVASLISLPLQSNFDFGLGTGSGWRYTLNVQPVIPVALSPKWNMISRTIIPIIHQGNVTGPNTSQSGLGDTVQSLFFSPNKSEPFIWAVGPVFLLPTATNASLGSQKWGLGPTVLALKQKKGWTYGVLANHIWSVAGKSSRADVNATFIQPFLSYSNKQAWTYGINTESTYDWKSHSWSTPIIPSISKLVRFGKQPVSFGGGVKCWVTTPTGGPEGCSLRIIVTALFPKK